MIKRYALLLASIMLIAPAFSQFLNWQYEDIITDTREVGASPASVLDPSGNLHVTFWNAEENRLYYGIRDRSTGQWTTEMVEDSAGGHVSALVLDAGLNVHVAFLAERDGEAYLRYARRSGGVWATVEQPAPDTMLGEYGPDLSVESKVHHSLDIRLAPDGEPIISFFDGSYQGIKKCDAGASGVGHPDLFLPLRYDFDLNVTRRDPSGNWEVYNLDYRINNQLNATFCEPISYPDDRFGEFCKLLPYDGGTKQLIVTNSFYNHELVVFASETDSMDRWEATVLDSAGRIMSVARIWPEDAFGAIDAQITNDTMLHVLCNFSQAYGRKLNTTSGRGNIRDMMYYRIPVSSLGNPALPGLYRHEFVLPPRDGNFRTHCAFAAASNNISFEAHYDEQGEVIVVAATGDGGQSWISDTVFADFETDSRLSLQLFSDSLYLLAYDAAREKLNLAVRSTGNRSWHYEQLTITERRGNTVAGAISASSQLYLASPEPCADQIEVAVRNGAGWQLEEASPAGMIASDMSMTAGSGENAWLAFTERSDGMLYLATRNANGWQQEQITQAGRAGNPDIAVNADSIWIAYTEELDGSLRLASRSINGGAWNDKVVDDSSARTGLTPVIRIGSAGDLHIAYRDQTQKVIRYANRNANVWSYANVSSDTTEQVFISLDMELDPLDGSPHIAYMDDLSGSLTYASPLPGGDWDYEIAFQALGSQFGSPMDLIITDGGDPWILFGYNVGGLDMRLIRKANGAWRDVALNGNVGQIALQFGFLRSDVDLFILGKKNRNGNEGLGMLYAEGGVTVNLDKVFSEDDITIYPNPALHRVEVNWADRQVENIRLMDINGRTVQVRNVKTGEEVSTFDLQGISPGLYFIGIKTEGRVITKKLLVQ